MTKRARWLVIIATVVCIVVSLAGSVSASTGDLDPTFGHGGIASDESGCGSWCTFAVDVTRLKDGRLALLGVGNTDGAHYFGSRSTGAIFSANGALRGGGFGWGPGSINSPRAIEPHPDGGAVMAGTAQRCITGTIYDEQTCELTRAFFMVVKYTSTGAPDRRFDVDGAVLTPIGGGHAFARNVAVQPDGKVVAVGSATVNGAPALAVVRYLPSGALDPTFGTNGRALFRNASGGDVAVLPSGKLVVVGSRGDRFLVMRLRANGALDPTFGTNGTVIAGFVDRPAEARHVVLGGSGELIVGGSVVTRKARREVRGIAVMRFTASGALDTTFDADGKVITNFDEGDAWTNDLFIDASGRIVAGGNNGLVRYTPAGRRDTTFSGDGRHWLPWPADGFILQGDKIVIAFDGLDGMSLARILT